MNEQKLFVFLNSLFVLNFKFNCFLISKINVSARKRDWEVRLTIYIEIYLKNEVDVKAR